MKTNEQCVMFMSFRLSGLCRKQNLSQNRRLNCTGEMMGISRICQVRVVTHQIVTVITSYGYCFVHRCRKQAYPSILPSASVVICFHNEAWTVLLRTIHSVLDRTPNHLHEIILVDDFSDILNLKAELENYIKGLPKVTVIRTDKREGLIRGRLVGANAASGEVIVFLDSHCEVNVDWLPPLLKRIQRNPHTVVCPVIDIISAHTFEYKESPIVRGGFNWGLYFSWEPVSPSLLSKPEDYVRPIRYATIM